MTYLKARKEYLQECLAHGKKNIVLAGVIIVFGAYSLAGNLGAFVDFSGVLFLQNLPKLPLVWAVIITLCGTLFIVVEGGYRYAESLKTKGAKQSEIERPKDINQDGPDVGVEYSYSDNDAAAKRDQPLILRNLSNKDIAHNVRVLPMTVGELNASFVPDVVPFIEPLGRKEVKVSIEGVVPLLREDFALLFKRNYSDKSTQELFGKRPYTMLIEYEDSSGGRLFETTAVIVFKPWQNETNIGETRRRIKKISVS
jgi:hypothetical protein